MLARRREGILEIRSVDGTFAREIDLRGLRAISSLRLDPSARWLAVTAVSGKGREPDVRANQRGDLRAHIIDVASGEQRVLAKDYAHDAMWWPDASRLVIHTGRGVTVLNAQDGSEEHRFDVGRFGWGPPSISVSHDAARVAFVKWRGDDRKIAVYDLATRVGRIFRPSCFHYCWWDGGRIAYDRPPSIHLLDVATGKTSVWVRRVTTLPDLTPLLAVAPDLREIVPERGIDTVSRPIRHAGRVYFHVFLAASAERRITAVVSLTDNKADLKVHAIGRGAQKLRDFALLDDARTLAVSFERYEGMRIVEHGLVYAGERADSIPEGFFPLPRLATPQFGFHALP